MSEPGCVKPGAPAPGVGNLAAQASVVQAGCSWQGQPAGGGQVWGRGWRGVTKSLTPILTSRGRWQRGPRTWCLAGSSRPAMPTCGRQAGRQGTQLQVRVCHIMMRQNRAQEGRNAKLGGACHFPSSPACGVAYQLSRESAV